MSASVRYEPIILPQIEEIPRDGFSISKPQTQFRLIDVNWWGVSISSHHLNQYLKDTDSLIRDLAGAEEERKKLHQRSSPMQYVIFQGLLRPRLTSPWITSDESIDHITVAQFDLIENRYVRCSNYARMGKHERGQRDDTSGFVYLVRSDTGHYKIGKAKNLEDRVKAFEVKLPVEISLEHSIVCENRHSAERELHRQYQHRRVRGEWFALTPDEVGQIKEIGSM